MFRVKTSNREETSINNLDDAVNADIEELEEGGATILSVQYQGVNRGTNPGYTAMISYQMPDEEPTEE